MLTVTCAPETTSSVSTQTQPQAVSDCEISQRVLRIRSNWSASERLQRRQDAESRFADLLTSLGFEAEAA